MNRRAYVKNFVLGSLIPLTSGYGFSNSLSRFFEGPLEVDFKSDWEEWPDMKWAGPQYWGNRLQDWRIKGGRLICDLTANNRSLHLLSVQNPDGKAPLELSVKITLLNEEISQYEDGCIGFRLGAKGPFEDYRSAAVFGNGLDIGLSPKGLLKFGSAAYETGLESIPASLQLKISTKPQKKNNQLLQISIMEEASGEVLFEKKDLEVRNEQLKGNIALLSHIDTQKRQDNHPSVAFEDWTLFSTSLYKNEERLFGPICFAQYTINKGKLKLTAQLAPIEDIAGHRVKLDFKKNGQWQTAHTTTLEHPGRAINFQFSSWEAKVDIPYRLRVEIPLKSSLHQYDYEGTIAREPIDQDRVKVAVFSCNAHYGFPDNDIYESVSKLKPDLAVFLGDQFYEGTGGFGAQYRGDFDKTCLDYLRKWMMFGWSYREIFRHIPCAMIPDDHDVYHGNVWGEAGKKADTSGGMGASAQDSGGYKMDARWVNMVQFTQTSHLPDPYDPRPVKQNIGVYFTHWNYGGISFAILEDRKFKSAPKNVLPAEAEVWNGWIMSDDFDIKEYKHLDAELLGKRQEAFLEDWVEDWSEGANMKVILSQTNFAAVATLPESAKNDSVVPSLYIPEPGEYIEGDRPTVDMDSNAWPAAKRDQAVAIIRKAFAFHIAGDQHLATFIQYGLDEHGDSGFAFAGPALNNLWPRRFWPPVDYSGHTYEKPAYVGDHYDGFGNKVTVKAVANPYNRHQEPAILHNRAVGYGIVTFDKKARTITTECFQRFKDPMSEEAQYPGWPITIQQADNYARKAEAWLPELRISGAVLPVLKIFDDQGELVYALRLPGFRFKPKVFEKGKYTIHLSVPETGFEKVFQSVKAKKSQKAILSIVTD
jgi:alkaline phosphatase D